MRPCTNRRPIQVPHYRELRFGASNAAATVAKVEAHHDTFAPHRERVQRLSQPAARSVLRKHRDRLSLERSRAITKKLRRGAVRVLDYSMKVRNHIRDWCLLEQLAISLTFSEQCRVRLEELVVLLPQLFFGGAQLFRGNH